MADGVFGDSPDGWGVRGGREGGRESVQELELNCFSLKPAGLRMSSVTGEGSMFLPLKNSFRQTHREKG